MTIQRDRIVFITLAALHLAVSGCGVQSVATDAAPESSTRSAPAGKIRPVPELGLIWNNDCDLAFTGDTPEESVRNFRLMVDRLAGTPVKTLTLSVGAGSDILYYPTKVASNWGWRELPDDRDPVRTRKAKQGTDAGIDAPRVAMEEAARLGIQFVPSLRMNDWHFCAKALTDPLTSRFWMEHHERLTIGKGRSPIDDPGAAMECENLLDFSHEEVRAFRLAQVQEIIDRYQDQMLGVELDFNRVQVFFPRGAAESAAPLMTDLVKQVRDRLDAAGARHRKTYYLLVRVPPALKNCRWAGLDVERWMKERLVDVVIPAQLMTLSHDMPVNEFVAAAGDGGCKIYPAIYPRSGFHWPFSEKAPVGGYPGGPDRRASPEMIRGAASNYWHMGAAGFQIYNFGWPDDDWTILSIHDLAHPAALAREDRTYVITPTYYLDHEDNYEYRKQIPLALRANEPNELTLYVGERFDEQEKSPAPDYLGLRIGLRNAMPANALEITLNGTVLHQGALETVFTATNGEQFRGGGNPDPATAYIQFAIKDASKLSAGKNAIVIRTAEQGLIVSECQLAVRYHRKLFSW